MCRLRLVIGIILMVSFLSIAYAKNNTPEFLFQKALYLETAKVDYKGAIEIYEKIIKEHEKNTEFVAKSFYRMGVCYEKIGQKEDAKECAQELKNNYEKIVKKNSEIESFVQRYQSVEGIIGSRHKCMNNLKQIGLALRLYAQDYNGKFPRELKELCPNYILRATLWCPGDNKISKSYVYVKGLTSKDRHSILAYDTSPDHHDGEGRNVLFVDGHVEWMVEKEFQRRSESEKLVWNFDPEKVVREFVAEHEHTKERMSFIGERTSADVKEIFPHHRFYCAKKTMVKPSTNILVVVDKDKAIHTIEMMAIAHINKGIMDLLQKASVTAKERIKRIKVFKALVRIIVDIEIKERSINVTEAQDGIELSAGEGLGSRRFWSLKVVFGKEGKIKHVRWDSQSGRR